MNLWRKRAPELVLQDGRKLTDFPSLLGRGQKGWSDFKNLLPVEILPRSDGLFRLPGNEDCDRRRNAVNR